MNTKMITIAMLTMFSVFAMALEARIVKLSGDVRVRLGVEERWNAASTGLVLREIDTILTGENSRVLLDLGEGRNFEMSGNSLIDIADLRLINEQELFLYLMQNKMKRIKPRSERTPLRIGNVSVVHGSTGDTLSALSPGKNQLVPLMRNGIRALFEQSYFPNTIIKLLTLQAEHDLEDNCGQMYYYLGKSFEEMNQKGQAMDAYENAVIRAADSGCETANWVQDAMDGLSRLE